MTINGVQGSCFSLSYVGGGGGGGGINACPWGVSRCNIYLSRGQLETCPGRV